MIRALRLPLGMAILLAERVRADFGTDRASDGAVQGAPVGAPVAAIEGASVQALDGVPALEGAPVGVPEGGPLTVPEGGPVALPEGGTVAALDGEPVAVPVVGVAAGYAIGLADATLSASGRMVRSAVAAVQVPARVGTSLLQAALGQSAFDRATAPARRATSAMADWSAATVARGRNVAAEARTEAVTLLRLESANGLAWVRGDVMPTMIDDLVADPKVRQLAMEQAHGAINDVALEVRRRSARADTSLEAGVRRLLGRDRRELAP
jgi:hypothetical protein